MADKSKRYVISHYMNTFAMYEADDFRLKDISFQLTGKFRRTSEYRGFHNGYEIGIFECDNGHKYLIFVDHSAIQLIT